MQLELLIGLRYLKNKGRKRGLVSFMSWISILGVLLGVLVPIIVMSVIGGFQREIREKILGITGHLTLTPVVEPTLNYDNTLIEKLRRLPGIKSVVPITRSQGLVELYGEYQPILLKGVDQSIFTEDPEFANLYQIVAGTNDLSRRYYLNIGEDLAKNNWVQLGERLKIIIAQNLSQSQTDPRIIKGMTTGFFKTGYLEYDSGVVYTSMVTIQKALDISGQCHEIHIKCIDEWNLQPIVDLIHQNFPYQFSVLTWKDLNANLFKALMTEKALMWVIVFLILLVAIFNVMSGQIMLVLDKKREIAILKSIGFTPNRIAAVFLIEGLVTTLVGAGLGVILGILVASHIGEMLTFFEYIINGFQQGLYFCLQLFADIPKPSFFAFFPEDVYYLDTIPVDIRPIRIILIFFGALTLSLIAGLVPAIRAAFMKPLEILRNE